MDFNSSISQILDTARWAPSGDNTQPWRFEVVQPNRLVVHGFDTRDHCVYDLDGHPSQISLGALLETIDIAASTHGLAVNATRIAGAPETRPQFELDFRESKSAIASPLAAVIEKRSVQRRALSTRPLTETERQRLSEAVGPGHRVHWLEGLGMRARAAKLMFHSAKLRLTIREAYEVHRDIIEWHAQFSKEKVPDQALGASPPTLVLMRQVMKSWGRVQAFNRFLAGTWAPRIELDLLPGLACAAHFLICAQNPATTLDDYVAAGRATQRFWLTATLLGLQLQPEVTPLVFTRYARNRLPFSKSPDAMPRAERVAARLTALVGRENADHAVFMGRIGAGHAAKARSIRRDLESLMHGPSR
ncbi:nitroreductase family protein [Roseateles saccharophilus]|uniref:Nitroreductase family protein n=1 Tax=Roseateles saccharophilus TaxID=304 RepID=A0A4R3U8M6_ROSSA|nr:nitroreductase family protein [Roseateles saccharophilus]MDG0836053.1 molybdopterin biosynthesis protein MoeY [Roseateles saccharophilus]TCU82156.1 nitroreductase family protein [Roseateles saccharophilus]